MDKDGDGILDEVSWSTIRADAKGEPSLQQLVWDMDDAQLELETFKELLRKMQDDKDKAEEARAASTRHLRGIEAAIERVSHTPMQCREIISVKGREKHSASPIIR